MAARCKSTESMFDFAADRAGLLELLKDSPEAEQTFLQIAAVMEDRMKDWTIDPAKGLPTNAQVIPAGPLHDII